MEYLQMREDFLYACAHGNMEEIKRTYKDQNIDVGLRVASQYGYFPIVQFLIEQGADVHSLSDQPLFAASQNGFFAIVEHILSKGTNFNLKKSFQIACAKGHLDIVKLLVKYGANVHEDEDHALLQAFYCNRFEVAMYLIEEHGADYRSRNDKAFLYACFRDLHIVKFLFEKGVRTPAGLTNAVVGGNFEIVKFLVANGWDAHKTRPEPIEYASRARSYDIVKFLLENGGKQEFILQKRRAEYEKYNAFCEKRKIWAANKIGSWWIPICYRLTDENGELRMAVKSWKKIEAMIEEKNK